MNSASLKPLTIGKVVCVGRNYVAHARELGNEVPSTPLLFMKPVSAIVNISNTAAANKIVRPDTSRYGETHYEAELCIQLMADLCAATVEQAQQAVGNVTLGLDLTLRDLQSKLKDKGQPWERAKCFDGSCVLADWVDARAFGDLTQVHYQLYINDELKQDGDSALMLFSVYELLADISHAFSLQAGDVIMTGTPSGVGILQAGDELKLVLAAHQWQAQVQ
ncbi:fumarylacetoacetate hydrolase family protein [Psychrobacter sp. TAE2020]|uniref:fumarylacetoacetate hydrolase family protein n=1 Tax=Psychrobacter sp. TAE2020 TaxID=2846762 RepID=UPI001C1012AD|nr:fumarylacetoacetate hydrolase family protein [Psychrobacter sp. TAE2020]MBU5616758.1 fumarylacetoacetate hydrolase family protein [Psychrobacter sp. TAE2020]